MNGNRRRALPPLVRLQSMQRVRLCWCILALLVHTCFVGAYLLCWCTSCSGKRQSRAETSAPPEVSSICVNPCNLWEASPASGSVSSVQSVGEYSQAEGSVNSVNSVGEPTHQAEFVLFVLFVFVSSQGYMCVSYIVLSDSNKFKLC